MGTYRRRFVHRPLVVFAMGRRYPRVLVHSVALECIMPVVAGVIAKLVVKMSPLAIHSSWYQYGNHIIGWRMETIVDARLWRLSKMSMLT